MRLRESRHGKWLTLSPASGVCSVGIRDKGLSLLLLMLSLLIISLSICFPAHQHKTYTAELLGGRDEIMCVKLLENTQCTEQVLHHANRDSHDHLHTQWPREPPSLLRLCL